MKLTTTIEATTMISSAADRAARLAQMIQAESVSVPVQVRIITKTSRQLLPVTNVKVAGGVVEVTSQAGHKLSVRSFNNVVAFEAFVDAVGKPVFLEDLSKDITGYDGEKRDELENAAAVATAFSAKVWDVAHGLRPASTLEFVATYSLIYDELFKLWTGGYQPQAEIRQQAA